MEKILGLSMTLMESPTFNPITTQETNILSPTINPIANQETKNGQAYSYTPTASGNPEAWSIDQASADLGMAINPLTGEITWTPSYLETELPGGRHR